MNKKLLIGIGAAAILVILAALLGKYIGYDIGYEKAVEDKAQTSTPDLEGWVQSKSITEGGQWWMPNVSIKYPPHEYCGDSEVAFICLSEKGKPDFHYAQWSYMEQADDFGCGFNFEDCIVEAKTGAKVISEKRVLLEGKQAVELEIEREQWGRSKGLYVDLGQEKGIFFLIQRNFTPALDKVYEGIVSSIEFK